MEILKFSEPPKRSSRSASARKSGLMPMVTFGIAVLVLGGMGTTLAGTITLNGTNNSVEFGQGVVTTAACDTSISIIPVSSYDTVNATFFVSQIKVAGIGSALSDTSSATVEGGLQTGCLGKTFTLNGYNSSGGVVPFKTGINTISFRIAADTLTAFATPPGNVLGLTAGFSSTTGGNFADFTGTAVDEDLTVGGVVTVNDVNASASLARITLETS
jgi:hypothetical protein